jgi:hypothetical protein
MELRRALLLFAIVLGLAAIASTIARAPDRGGDESTDTAASARPAESEPSASSPGAKTPQPTTIEFRNRAKPQTHTLEQGQPATVLVDVETPGQVDIPSLGLTDTGEPLTPAMFEILEVKPGSHAIMVQPAASETLPSKVGTLKIVPVSPPS